MLDEYDFSKGVRGKYSQQYYDNNLPDLKGILFLVDNQGRKIGVLIDFHEYQSFLRQIINQCNSTLDFQYLINSQGQKVAVILNFKEHLEIWQALYDRLIIDLLD